MKFSFTIKAANANLVHVKESKKGTKERAKQLQSLKNRSSVFSMFDDIKFTLKP